jgi:hypothetical protein
LFTYAAFVRGGALRLKKIRLAKEGAEQVNVFGFIDLAVRELVSFLDGAVEICLNDVAIKIADHEERRILEGLAITQELFVSRLEIFLFAFVLPGEAVLFPNIGETALFARFRIVLACFFLQKKYLGVFDDTFLEAKRFRAGRVGFGRRFFPEKPADVTEMFLVGRGLFSLEPVPLLLELSQVI